MNSVIQGSQSLDSEEFRKIGIEFKNFTMAVDAYEKSLAAPTQPAGPANTAVAPVRAPLSNPRHRPGSPQPPPLRRS